MTGSAPEQRQIFLTFLLLATALMAVADEPKGRLGPLPADQVAKPRDRAASQPLSPYDDALAYKEKGSRALAIEGRIVGGTPAPIGAYPWTVAIGTAGEPMSVGQFCGGSLIAPRWVVTAAHCVDRVRSPERISVKHGSNYLSSGGQITEVAEIRIHPQWNRARFANDVALLRLKSDVADATPVRLLAQESANELFATGTLAVVAGWGLTAGNGAPSDVLRHVGVKVVANETCNAPNSYAGQIEENMVCAGFAAGEKDSCQGDSGGPLMIFDRKGGYMLAGVVSWGEGCAQPDKYGVYARISLLKSWIETQI